MHQSDNAVCWRDDIDALAFEPDNHRGFCMVHRLAFRTLLQFFPEPDDCLAFFRDQERAFRAAARAKIARSAIAHEANFHLTSRDIIEQMGN
ncbi:hypothetical protein [Bradyrhizobium paxllaeri]|uniref:hypothetical protein n=1 Tax=Bradyrhizobium paxllaeri TaxID=190148 RepID=UPI0008106D73|nr:hypothetical protein [Bradyrhizobium paxllaeri]